MSIQFDTARVRFDAASGGPQTETGEVSFMHRVKAADAAIKGYSIGFEGDDHHLYQEKVEIKSVRLNGTKVEFGVELALRDKSGHYDDNFSGEVIVMVTADVEQQGDASAR